MDCSAIQGLLSEFIDGTLDVQTRTAVEKHISTCENCKQELASLRAVVEELDSLDQVKAPADFLEKIHERMEPHFSIDRLIRKLFVPFHIKIPLELAAVTTVTILVVLVLNIQQPEIQMMKIPTASKSQRFAKNLKEDRIKPEFKKEAESPAPVLEEAPAKLSDSEHVMLARRSKSKAVKPSIQRESEPYSPVLAKAKQPIGKGQRIELALVLKTGVIGDFYEPGIAMQATPLLESDEKATESERADIDSFGGKLEAGKRGSATDLLSRMKHIIGLVQGKVLTVDYDSQAEQLKSIHAKIPTKSYKLFCKKLARLATFQSPPPDLTDKDLETIQVRIRFISL
jgi:hypothetical protein